MYIAEMKRWTFITACLLSLCGFGQTGTASYYANKFEGRKTSSGEIFSQKKLTAAHKTLPLGTMVRLTNLSNDSVVVVKINDRLPKSSKRMIDLSRAAAEQLNFIVKGLTQVRMEVLDNEYLKPSYPAGDYRHYRDSLSGISCGILSQEESLRNLQMFLAFDSSRVEKGMEIYYSDLAWCYYRVYMGFQEDSLSDYGKVYAERAAYFYGKAYHLGDTGESTFHNLIFILFRIGACEQAEYYLDIFRKIYPQHERTGEYEEKLLQCRKRQQDKE